MTDTISIRRGPLAVRSNCNSCGALAASRYDKAAVAFLVIRFPRRQSLASFRKRAQHIEASSIRRRMDWSGTYEHFHKNNGGKRMTQHVSRTVLACARAGLAPPPCSGRAAAGARAQTREPDALLASVVLGGAEVTVVSDGSAAAWSPKGTFIGVPDEEVRKMLSDNFLSPDNVVLEQNSPIVNTGDKLVLFDTAWAP